MKLYQKFFPSCFNPRRMPYILHQPKDRLMWGAGRILHHENLYGLVQRLKELDPFCPLFSRLPPL